MCYVLAFAVLRIQAPVEAGHVGPEEPLEHDADLVHAAWQQAGAHVDHQALSARVHFVAVHLHAGLRLGLNDRHTLDFQVPGVQRHVRRDAVHVDPNLHLATERVLVLGWVIPWCQTQPVSQRFGVSWQPVRRVVRIPEGRRALQGEQKDRDRRYRHGR